MTSMSGLRQGFPQENGLRPVLQHAWRARRAADCLRFASPAEATGGLELGGLEEACKRLGRGLEYLMGVVSGVKFHEKCLSGELLTAQTTKVACKECQEEGKEGQGGPKDDQIDTPSGPKTSPRRLIWESWR